MTRTLGLIRAAIPKYDFNASQVHKLIRAASLFKWPDKAAVKARKRFEPSSAALQNNYVTLLALLVRGL